MASNHWSKKYTKCLDGGDHEGRLELMTWGSFSSNDLDEKIGWGGVIMEEVEEHKESLTNTKATRKCSTNTGRRGSGGHAAELPVRWVKVKIFKK